jgi:hypothetical protein
VSEFVRVPKTLVAFLNGEAPLEGLWFSDDPRPTGRAPYWWRMYLLAAPTAPPASPGPEPLTEHERRWLDSMTRDPDPQANNIRRRDVALIRRLAAIADHYRNQCAQGKD